jgi:hypothetical protein
MENPNQLKGTNRGVEYIGITTNNPNFYNAQFK